MFCCFGFTRVAFGGVVELRTYKITVHGVRKSIIFVSVIHEPDLNRPTFIFDPHQKVGFLEPGVIRHDNPDHCRHFTNVIKHMMNSEEEEEWEEDDFCTAIILDVHPRMCIEKNIDLFTGQLGRYFFQEDGETIEWLNDEPILRRIGRCDVAYADIKDLEMTKFLYLCHGRGVPGFSLQKHLQSYYPRYAQFVHDFRVSVEALGKKSFFCRKIRTIEPHKGACLEKPPPGTSFIQWNYHLVNLGLGSLSVLRAAGSFARAEASIPGVYKGCLKHDVIGILECIIPNMNFFSRCVDYLLHPEINNVVLVVGQHNTVHLGRMLEECGAQLVRRVGPFYMQVGSESVMTLQDRNACMTHGATGLFITPAQLNSFSEETLLEKRPQSRLCRYCS